MAVPQLTQHSDYIELISRAPHPLEVDLWLFTICLQNVLAQHLNTSHNQ
jgi:hypothetical protein